MLRGHQFCSKPKDGMLQQLRLSWPASPPLN